jgi:hypothetical protein
MENCYINFMDATRIINVKEKGEQRGRKNDQTVLMPYFSIEKIPFESLFYKNHSKIKSFIPKSTGLCVFVFSNYSLVGQAFVSSKENTANSLILGRHNQSEVFLGNDPNLSLRHLVFIVHPRGKGVQFQILDLHSTSGFKNEMDQPCQSITANGPTFIRLNHYHIMCFPTPSTALMDDDSSRAWNNLPKRHHSNHFIEVPDHDSLIVSNAPPSPLKEGPTKHPIAKLELFFGQNYVSQPLDNESLRRGIIIGRNDKCEKIFQPFLLHPYISRIHFLLIEIENEYYIIDTASTNGVYIECSRYPRIKLPSYLRFYIGDISPQKEKLYLEWKTLA